RVPVKVSAGTRGRDEYLLKFLQNAVNARTGAGASMHLTDPGNLSRPFQHPCQCKKSPFFLTTYEIVTNVMMSAWTAYIQLIETLQDSKNLKIKLLTGAEI